MKKLAQANNYKYIRDINAFYGESKGYYFYSEETQYVSLIRLYFTIIETPELKPALDRICESYRAVSHDGVRMEAGKAILEIRPQGFSDPHELHELIEALTDTMRRLKISQGTGILGLYRVGTHLVVQEEAVLRSQTKDLAQTFKKQSVSPLMGFVMAFVYMIPAILLYALVMNVGFVFSILGFFIMLQALRGFEKYGGLPSRNQLYFLLGMSYLGLMLARIVFLYFTVYQLPYFSLGLFIKSLDYIGLVVEVLPSFLIAGVFNFNRIRDIFGNARTTHVVNRSIKKLL